MTITRIKKEEVLHLQTMSIETFTDTFAEQNSEENLHAYLETAYQLEKLKAELDHPASEFYFLFVGDERAGYLKINHNGAQTEDMGDDALEIERIYIHQAFQNQGLGNRLFKKALERASDLDKQFIWLGVWEENHNAIQFYEKKGFTHVSAHPFYMGDEEQIDLIMKKAIHS